MGDENYEKRLSVLLLPIRKRRIVGYQNHFGMAGTDRGCIEAPHPTPQGTKYYYMPILRGAVRGIITV